LVAPIHIIITDKYPLLQAQEAMELAMNNKSGSLKVMVYPNEGKNV
jgi:L-iditol 2-dehydrogenase